MKLRGMFDSLVRLIGGGRRSSVGQQPAESSASDSGFVAVGEFSPPEFSVVRVRLEHAGVDFEIECDTSAPASNIEGMHSERDTIGLLVRHRDVAAAVAIIDSWRVESGRVKRNDAQI